MKKKMIISALIFIFSSLLFASDDTYVFEAKGSFAKDLKALIEKHKKDGNIDVTVYKKTDIENQKSNSLTNTILLAFSKNDAESLKNADINVGQKLYSEQCASCHGVNADENSYANSRKLSTLMPMEIVELLNAYKSNVGYRRGSNDFGNKKFGGSTSFIMKPRAENLSTNEIQSIAVYIYSLNHNEKLQTEMKKPTQPEKSDEKQSSYLE